MTDITDGVPFLQAAHFHIGRDGRKIDTIIIHWMNTNLAGADATFTGGVRVASATYGIENITIHQYVKERDASYSAADWDANMRSISIEHSAAVGRNASASTIETSIQVMVAKCRQYGINPDRIFPHNKYTATMCPGTLPWEAMREEVRRRLANPSEEDIMTPAQEAKVDLLLKYAVWNNTMLKQVAPESHVRVNVLNSLSTAVADIGKAIAALKQQI